MYLPLLLTGFLLIAIGLRAEKGAEDALVGSDLLSEPLIGPLEEFAKKSEIELSLDFIGSLPAINALHDGDATIGLIAIPQGDPLPEDRLRLIPFAYQVAFVLFNANNPLSELSIPELARIYALNASPHIDRWGQLDAGGALMTRTVQPFISSPQGSVVTELFKSEALSSRSIGSSVAMLTSSSELIDLISADLGAIGVSNRPASGSETKSISISTGEAGSFAFGPTPENIYYGDYPLRLPFYIAVPTGDLPKQREIIAFLLSDEVASVLEKAGFVPLSENVRKRTLLGLDIGE
ncbi:PstS family phosphate ABC transporter substrate-binding protein [Rubellicoccus peritrichatus]|uniref:PBP domain-containing protein n=1 Tax=Rubellicoccus peritrichatus TaxID=3080537 RepID=A0AAQ3LCC0_9BACT|nr:substrate-binding domain-containing protein [Puniceicoccus sp. CR14]WOO40933.1 hypothetical protein RZN69_20115 [Puniceicoccus sp. CR14]